MPKRTSPRSVPPVRATAILVIHGIGEQQPFETLDAFARTLVLVLEESTPCTLQHKFRTRTDSSGSPWQEHYLHIEREKGTPIEVHEYYWSYLASRTVDLQQILDWVEKTLWSTKKFYSEHPELLRAYEKERRRKSFPLMRVLWYLRITLFFRPFWNLFSTYLFPLVRFVSLSSIANIVVSFINGFLNIINLRFDKEFESRKGFENSVTSVLWGKLLQKIGWVVTEYIGDVVAYTSMDDKSVHYAVRQRILAESQSLLEQIMGDDEVGRVIVAGHSLGSVIAYDTLNKINIKANLPEGAAMPVQKIDGLITFGSPLDKIAFFFHEENKKENYIRQAFLDHLHSFKALPTQSEPGSQPVGNPIASKLDSILWYNYYSPKDPISGHLDAYAIPDGNNISVLEDSEWGKAHVKYWVAKEMYFKIIEKLLE